MAIEVCKVCGLNLALVGLKHVCRPRDHSPPVPIKPAQPKKAVSNRPSVSNSVSNNLDTTVSNRQRLKAWRSSNTERYRNYMAGYMRDHRKGLRRRKTKHEPTQSIG